MDAAVTEPHSVAANRLRTQYALLGILLIAPAVLVFLIIIAYPLVSAIYLSLFSIYTPTLKGHWVGFQNYVGLLSHKDFWGALVNNFIWMLGTLTLQIIFGIAAALLLNQNLIFRALARSLILFPYFISTVVAVLVWRWLFNDLYGILNYAMVSFGLVRRPLDWLGQMPNAMISLIFVGAWKYFPFVVITVLARLQTIPLQLYEAARMDGAGPIARFFDITLPQLRDVLLIVILLRSIWDFKEFDLLYLMTGGGPVTATQTLPLLVYKQAFGVNEMGQACAIAVSMMIVMFGFMLLYFRAMRRAD
jgi:multiple sugar transport system permease protein